MRVGLALPRGDLPTCRFPARYIPWKKPPTPRAHLNKAFSGQKNGAICISCQTLRITSRVGSKYKPYQREAI